MIVVANGVAVGDGQWVIDVDRVAVIRFGICCYVVV